MLLKLVIIIGFCLILFPDEGENLSDCSACITTSSCYVDDMYVDYNLNVLHCKYPFTFKLIYYTDLSKIVRFINVTVYHAGITVVRLPSIRFAWDYTLCTPYEQSDPKCSRCFVAKCTHVKLFVWYITGGISVIFICMGFFACCKRYFDSINPNQTNERTPLLQESIINS
ncbi:unnamed protein product [Didymodactylos carnosus]|uniref:Uncharacterized protein n=1 Tax=Didymodactylos carnosus TaxID=1234261 RepID=A0A813Q5H9_9BILA|nr:unnamed protein product [Didymodactylos carnosus]CAF0851793.1 unnamed protein product [Didymodactylos carnosus]CAF3543372.1 unnamed protein product [Didymodactylos carnosus]CAF3636987.1 unnamed protein product [Didymodactylos carnosus]